MKVLTISFLLLLVSSFAMADETIISCTDSAQKQTLIDFTSMIRNKSGFETGDLTIKKQNSEEYKNMILSKGYDEEKDEITYQATIAGVVTNSINNKSVFSIDQCEIKFVASSCVIKTQTCNGI